MTYPYTLTNGTTADANQVMANFNYVLSVANAAANAPVNTNITQLAGLTTPLTSAQGGSSVYNSASPTVGSANAQQLSTTSPSGFTLITGNMVLFQVGAGLTNTAGVTLSVAGTAFTNILKRTAGGLQVLAPGDLTAGQYYFISYDGVQYELLTTQGASGGIGTIASAATTDLGTIPFEVVRVTGTTAITSFGSSATAGTVKYLIFTGTPLLTYNATSLLLPGQANTQTAANDCAIAVYLGSGNWQVVAYLPTLPSNTQVFISNGTYTAPGWAHSVKVEGCGAGGAGGGTPTTGASQAAVGASGSGGSYGAVLITAGFTGGIAVTVGAGGGGAANANGNPGGNTTFGAILTFSGGNGGSRGTAGTTPFIMAGAAAPVIPTFTGTGTILYLAQGQVGGLGIAASSAAAGASSGNGGNSPWGSGGPGALSSNSGNSGSGAGAGGSGAASAASNAGTGTGGAGTVGILFITAYP